MRVWILLCVFLLSGCSTERHTLAPVENLRPSHLTQKNDYHLVRQGESLYAIAWRYGIDFKMLAAMNDIEAPYVIQVGQRLVLKEHLRRPTKGEKIPSPKVYHAKNNFKPLPKPAPPPASKSHVKWLRPVPGPLLSDFKSSTYQYKGVEFEGQLGESVHAAADGKVVYAGTGIRGYGHLVIIKHDETYLSAYAHNDKILVNEGQGIKQGQVIAHMGKSGTNRVKLHFEIRKNGKPVNPMEYLPQTGV